MDKFDEMWEVLAKGGYCDAVGSKEYERVKAAWEKFGYFNHLWQFIIACANVRPNNAPRSDGAKGGVS